MKRQTKLFDRPEWMDRGACLGVNPGVFFDDVSPEGVAKAKAICATCPVVKECLDYAIERKLTEEYHGVWGGTNHSERRSFARRRRLRRMREAG